jgi:hypothetical protein
MRFRLSALTLIVGLLSVHFLSLQANAFPEANAKSNFLRRPLLFEPILGQNTDEVEYVERGSIYLLQLSKQGAKVILRDDRGCEQELELSLEGSLPNPVLLGLRETAARAHYFAGDDPAKWRTNVPTYGAVIYKDVYPGIDWMFYERDGSLEYDFIVAPGAEPSQIRLKLKDPINWS